MRCRICCRTITEQTAFVRSAASYRRSTGALPTRKELENEAVCESHRNGDHNVRFSDVMASVAASMRNRMLHGSGRRTP